MITKYESFNEKLIIDDIILNESIQDIKNKVLSYLKKGLLTTTILLSLLGSVKASDKQEILNLVKQENPELYQKVSDQNDGDVDIKKMAKDYYWNGYKSVNGDNIKDKLYYYYYKIKNDTNYLTFVGNFDEWVSYMFNYLKSNNVDESLHTTLLSELNPDFILHLHKINTNNHLDIFYISILKKDLTNKIEEFKKKKIVKKPNTPPPPDFSPLKRRWPKGYTPSYHKWTHRNW